MRKFIFDKTNKAAISIHSKIAEKVLYFKGSDKVYKGVYVRILNNSKFFSLKKDSANAKQLSIRKGKSE